MPRETQKAKIERLEKEIEEYKGIVNNLMKRINDMQDKAEDSFDNSPTYIQMSKEIEDLKTSSAMYKEMYNSNRNKIKETAASYEKVIHKLNNEILELKEMLNLKNTESSIHNARGAGRKSKFNEEDKEIMKSYRSEGKTIKEIAKIYNCSVGLVHKLINEK